MPKIKIQPTLLADSDMASQLCQEMSTVSGICDVQIINEKRDERGKLIEAELMFTADTLSSQAAAEDAASTNGSAKKAVSFPKKITEEFSGAAAGDPLPEILAPNGKLRLEGESGVEVSEQGEGNGNDYALRATRAFGASVTMYPTLNDFSKVKAGTFSADFKTKNTTSSDILFRLGESRGQSVTARKIGANVFVEYGIGGENDFIDTGVAYADDTYYSLELKYSSGGFSIKLDNVEVASSEEPQYSGFSQMQYQTRNIDTYLDKIKCWVTDGE